MTSQGVVGADGRAIFPRVEALARAMGKSRLVPGRLWARSPPRRANARRASTAANAPWACHGGARPCGNTVLPTVGNCLGPASVCLSHRLDF